MDGYKLFYGKVRSAFDESGQSKTPGKWTINVRASCGECHISPSTIPHRAANIASAQKNAIQMPTRKTTCSVNLRSTAVVPRQYCAVIRDALKLCLVVL